LLIQTIALSLATEGAKRDPSAWNAVKGSAKRNAIDVGIDLDTIAWTATSFVPLKGGKR
jgi:hypothetical protein